MMHYLRYSGQFLSRKNVIWQVNIYQLADREFSSVGVLRFPSDEPIVIEWENADKTQVICGSTATVQVESPGDRTYEDLYTIEVGSIRLDVLREGGLYWSGTLDPEFYQEPYEQVSHYIVTLTFSDFGILDRLKYNLANMRTLRELLDYSIGRSGINITGTDETFISTSVSSDSRFMSLSDLQVRSDNFYDEDGEALSLKEMLEGILTPLALHMIQRNGKIYVYDFNGLYTKGTVNRIEWNGNRSTMGVDCVYNNAKITWSTYAQSGNFAPTKCWDIETDNEKIALNQVNGYIYGESTLFSYHYSTELSDWVDATDAGFTLWLSKEGSNMELVSDTVRFYKIVPQYDGVESEGVALSWVGVSGWKKDKQYSLTSNRYGVDYRFVGTLSTIGSILFKSASVWIPPTDNGNSLLLRITLNMLMDPRFNPFEASVNWMKGVEQKDWESQWNARGNFVYVPVTIKFQPDGENTIYVWTNKSIVAQPVSNPVRTLTQTCGQWTIFNDSNSQKPNTWGYLCYYQAEDRAERSGVVGWKKNRPAINPHTGNLVSILRHSEDGQYIPYPTYGGSGGKLWIEVRDRGWMISDGDVNLSSTEVQNPYNLWDQKYEWVLCQLPEIEIVNNIQFNQTINTDDVEYKSELNGNAKEDIEIETICGSSPDGVPTARGAYFSTASGNQIKTLARGGRITQIEELLIGTLYSQFAHRMTKLTGEVEIITGGMEAYAEVNQGEKKFIVTAEVQDIIADTSDATFVEFRPDEYDKKED